MILALETHSVGSSLSVTEEDYSLRAVLDVGRQVTHSKSQILISGLCWVGLFWTKARDHSRRRLSGFALTKRTRHGSRGNGDVFSTRLNIRKKTKGVSHK
jgi:hypothetical protein